jgi:hypothetical protein
MITPEIIAAIKTIEPIKPLEQFFVSKNVFDRLKELQLPSNKEYFSYGGYNFPVIESSLFPFEIMYDACDVETKLEIKIPSGEWIHGVAIPQTNWDELLKPSFDMYYERQRDWFSFFKGTDTYP